MPTMRIFRAALLISALSAARIYGWDPQTRPLSLQPEITLLVSTLKIDIPMREGVGLFRVDAQASKGFAGSVSGTISVSAPTNPERVHLTEGGGLYGKTFQFTLQAGQRLSDVQAQKDLTWWIKTSPTNASPGGLIYSVTLNPSRRYTSRDSPQAVHVTVVDTDSTQPCPNPFNGCGLSAQ